MNHMFVLIQRHSTTTPPPHPPQLKPIALHVDMLGTYKKASMRDLRGAEREAARGGTPQPKSNLCQLPTKGVTLRDSKGKSCRGGLGSQQGCIQLGLQRLHLLF